MENKELIDNIVSDIPSRIISWTVFPFKDEKRAAVLICVFLVALFVYLYFVWGSLYMILGIVIMLSSLWEFFTPVSYTFRENGIEIKTVFTKKTYEWSRFRNFLIDKKGVLLSPFSGRSRLERFRGVSIRFLPEKREEIIEYIKKRMARDS